MSTMAVKAVLLKGLTCGYTTACQSGTSITAGKFTLFCSTPLIRSEPLSTGGSYPLQPGQILQLYQPVPDVDQYLVVPRNQEAEYFRQRVPVTVKLLLGDRSIEKEYLVPKEQAKIVVNVITLVNVTKERISASIKNIKRIYNRVAVKVSKFRRER